MDHRETENPHFKQICFIFFTVGKKKKIVFDVGPSLLGLLILP